MKRIFGNLFLLFLVVNLATFSSCNKVAPDDYGIFSAQNDTTAIMNGTINSKTPQYWENYITAFSNTKMIIMKDCPGSCDDEANLEAARAVKLQNLAIHLPADAEIASGAVDFFLAGNVRTREAGSKIGVHSWAEAVKTATDYEVGHEKHQPYIDYYIDMGFSQADAEAFYYFTINAAPASDIHWMTDEEIEQYGLLTP